MLYPMGMDAAVMDMPVVASLAGNTAWERQYNGLYQLTGVPITAVHTWRGKTRKPDADGKMVEVEIEEVYDRDRLTKIALDAQGRNQMTIHVGHKMGALNEEGAVDGFLSNVRLSGDLLVADYVNVRPAFFDNVVVKQSHPFRSVEFFTDNLDRIKGVAHLGNSVPYLDLPPVTVSMTPEEYMQLQSDIASDMSYMAYRSNPAAVQPAPVVNPAAPPAPASVRSAELSPQMHNTVMQILEEQLNPIQEALSRLTTMVKTVMATNGELHAEPDGDEAPAANDGADKRENTAEKETTDDEEGEEPVVVADAEEDKMADDNADKRSADLSEFEKRMAAEAKAASMEAEKEVAAIRSRLSTAIDSRVFFNAPARIEAIVKDVLAVADPAIRSKMVDSAVRAYSDNAAPIGRLNVPAGSPSVRSNDNSQLSNADYAEKLVASYRARNIPTPGGWGAKEFAAAFDAGKFDRAKFTIVE